MNQILINFFNIFIKKKNYPKHEKCRAVSPSKSVISKLAFDETKNFTMSM